MAEKTLEIGIIGLGKFGLRMATTLASMGHTVIGIDMSDARVQLAEELLDTVYKADATSLSVLRSLHVQDLDWVVISVGEGVEQSLSITLNVQELGGPKIWVKASNEEHKKILQRLHVDRAIVPEMEAAVMAAHHVHRDLPVFLQGRTVKRQGIVPHRQRDDHSFHVHTGPRPGTVLFDLHSVSLHGGMRHQQAHVHRIRRAAGSQLEPVFEFVGRVHVAVLQASARAAHHFHIYQILRVRQGTV